LRRRRAGDLGEERAMTTRTHPRTGRWGVVIFWCVILVVVGLALRVLGPDRESSEASVVHLERPLSELPLVFGSWEGVDVPVDPQVLQVAKNDDYVSRRYYNRATGKFVDFYLAYTARPANMLGHRPSVCYPAQGWISNDPEEIELTLQGGKRMACLIHRFSRDVPTPENLVVLNYYVLAGQTTADWTDFWGPKWRRPNAAGDPTFYVAQVQVATPVMVPAMMDRGAALVQEFASEITPLVKALLPLTDDIDAGIDGGGYAGGARDRGAVTGEPWCSVDQATDQTQACPGGSSVRRRGGRCPAPDGPAGARSLRRALLSRRDRRPARALRAADAMARRAYRGCSGQGHALGGGKRPVLLRHLR